MGLFTNLVAKYLRANPQVVERLVTIVLDRLIEHVAPSTAASLVGEASASPLDGSAGLGSIGGQVISR